MQLGRGECGERESGPGEAGCIEWGPERGQPRHHRWSSPNHHKDGDLLAGLVSLALLLPLLAAAVRRLHDTGRTGWWLLLFATIIGNIWLIWWLARPSQTKKNPYGPKPVS